MRKAVILFSFLIFLVACEDKKVAKQEDVVFYTCSMDPQVVSDKPGKCPICGMELTPVKKGSVKNTNDIELSDQQIQLGNIIIDTIGKNTIGSTLELTGILTTDASKNSSVNARIMGRIEKLYVKAAGDYVAKGAPLYELYSEELNTAKQEYIAALQRRNLFKDQALIDFEELIESARNKLKLWGVAEGQIQALEKQTKAPLTTTFYSTANGYVISLDVTEGGYVNEGSPIVQLTDLSTLWAEAQVYSSQMYQIPSGAMATVRIPAVNKEIKGRIEFVNPEVEEANRVNILRVTIPNNGKELTAGMPVFVKVSMANRKSLALPTDAIIRQANGATVWLQTGKNKFKSQMVTTGLESEGITEVVSGLKEGDVVVVRGTYLLHSEFLFKRGTDPMEGHNH